MTCLITIDRSLNSFWNLTITSYSIGLSSYSLYGFTAEFVNDDSIIFDSSVDGGGYPFVSFL